MTPTRTEQELRRLVVDTLLAEACHPGDPADVGPDTRIGSDVLPLGSLAFVQALIAIEDQVGVAFADRLFREVRDATVGDVVRYAADAMSPMPERA